MSDAQAVLDFECACKDRNGVGFTEGGLICPAHIREAVETVRREKALREWPRREEAKACDERQLDLFKGDLYRKTEAWILNNPAAFALLEGYARQMMARRQAFGIAALYERVRWESALRWGGLYKLNNSHRAYVARILIERNPGMDALLRTRKAGWAKRPKGEGAAA